VFVQVPFDNKRSSTTEKPFGGHFQLTNEALRQVHKIFAYSILSAAIYRICWWFGSGVCEVAVVVPGMLCVLKQKDELCENNLKDSLHVSIILNFVCVWKNSFWKFFFGKYVTNCLNVLPQKNKNNYRLSLNVPQNAKLLPMDKNVQWDLHVFLEFICDWLKISTFKYWEQHDLPICSF